MRVQVSPSKALVIAMLLHELGTNAVKYGALSNAEGHIDLAWSVGPQGDRERLMLRWMEIGGPDVSPPSRKGFGTRMIERALQAEGGSARLEFQPKGLVCAIDVTL